MLLRLILFVFISVIGCPGFVSKNLESQSEIFRSSNLMLCRLNRLLSIGYIIATANDYISIMLLKDGQWGALNEGKAN